MQQKQVRLKFLLHTVSIHIQLTTTLKILNGIGSGLHYIHTRRNPSVIHADLKPDNILLDQEYNPKICDFGAVIEEGAPQRQGTPGYIDPFTYGIVELGTDIYSYGVIMMQLITKRERTVSEEEHITTIIETAFKEGRLLVHQSLQRSGCNNRTGKKITKLTLQCTDREIGKRPLSADDVVDALGHLGTKEGMLVWVLNLMKCKTT